MGSWGQRGTGEMQPRPTCSEWHVLEAQTFHSGISSGKIQLKPTSNLSQTCFVHIKSKPRVTVLLKGTQLTMLKGIIFDPLGSHEAQKVPGSRVGSGAGWHCNNWATSRSPSHTPPGAQNCSASCTRRPWP